MKEWENRIMAESVLAWRNRAQVEFSRERSGSSEFEKGRVGLGVGWAAGMVFNRAIEGEGNGNRVGRGAVETF